jgi:hypothetical protein
MSMDISVRQYLSEIGKRGGQSRSAAKIASGRINCARALEARLKKQLPKKAKLFSNSDEKIVKSIP